jgi:ABC-2 type transport system ATP-binding protein
LCSEADPAVLTSRMPASIGDPGAIVTQALGELSTHGVRVADFAFGQPSLDEVFLALTGRPADAAGRASERVA